MTGASGIAAMMLTRREAAGCERRLMAGSVSSRPRVEAAARAKRVQQEKPPGRL